MKTVKIKPFRGLLVRDPVTMQPLAADGEVKPLIGKEGKYWKRRLLDKSVEIVTKDNISIVAFEKTKRKRGE